MTPGDQLLDYYDELVGQPPRYTRVSEPDDPAGLFAVVYNDAPHAGASMGFTCGLSHVHQPDGSHKELLIAMQDVESSWALACAYLAYQLKERCSFQHGDVINFHATIAHSSGMSAFLVVHPLWLAKEACRVDLGVRTVELMQLVPLYDEERAGLLIDANVQRWIAAHPGHLLMNPNRPPLVLA